MKQQTRSLASTKCSFALCRSLSVLLLLLLLLLQSTISAAFLVPSPAFRLHTPSTLFAAGNKKKKPKSNIITK
jgi:hypothetical protein